MPASVGGTGEGFLYYACMNEAIGRSYWAQLVFGCQAPDAGNAEILHLLGTPEQKERFLEPLITGRARSFFSMTEPDVAGSDPRVLDTRAVVDGDEWVVDGLKWFSTGADDSDFGIVFAITDPDADTYKRGTMILVPTDTAGLEVVRAILGDGARGQGVEHPLRGPLHGSAGSPGEHARRPGRCIQDRPAAPRTGPHPPRDALARSDAARVRPHVLVRARA